MTELTELFATNDMDKLNRELARLVQTKDYKTIKELLRSNSNIWTLNTKVLNEEIPCDDRHFTKPKCVLKLETKQTMSNTHKVKKNSYTEGCI